MSLIGPSKLFVDWKKYGSYEFQQTSSDPITFDGHVVGKPENWRKLEYLRDFTAEEKILQGRYGVGSAWNFEYQGKYLMCVSSYRYRTRQQEDRLKYNSCMIHLTTSTVHNILLIHIGNRLISTRSKLIGENTVRNTFHNVYRLLSL